MLAKSSVPIYFIISDSLDRDEKNGGRVPNWFSDRLDRHSADTVGKKTVSRAERPAARDETSFQADRWERCTLCPWAWSRLAFFL